MCWCKLLAQCKCGRCGVLCCARDKKQPKGTTSGNNTDTLPLNVRYETQDTVIINAHGINECKRGANIDQPISIPICDATTELSLVQHKKLGNDYSTHRLSQYSTNHDCPTPPSTKVARN